MIVIKNISYYLSNFGFGIEDRVIPTIKQYEEEINNEILYNGCPLTKFGDICWNRDKDSFWMFVGGTTFSSKEKNSEMIFRSPSWIKARPVRKVKHPEDEINPLKIIVGKMGEMYALNDGKHLILRPRT